MDRMTVSVPDNVGLAMILTYRCNSRCSHCFIWRRPPQEKELTLQEYREVFRTSVGKAVSSLSISGGEPFMRVDAEAVLRSVPSNIPLLVGTNALLGKRIERILERIRAVRPIAVQISIDGIGDTHDRIRGVPGNFDKAVSLLEWCELEGIPATVSFTLGSGNYQDLLEVERLVASKSAHFTFRPVNRGEFYGNLHTDFQASSFEHEQLDTIEQNVRQLLKRTLSEGYYDTRDYVFWGYCVDYLKSLLEFPECFAARNFFLVDPSGVLLPCPQYFKPMGRIQNWPEVYLSDERKRVAEQVRKLECGGCWNDCFIWNSLNLQPEWTGDKYRVLLKERVGVPEPVPAELYFECGESVPFLGAGWFPGQQEPGRWMMQRASFFIAPGKTLNLDVENGCPQEGVGPRAVEVSIGGQSLGSVTVRPNERKSVAFDLPDNLTDSLAFEVEISCDQTWCPADLGLSKDRRNLGLRIRRAYTTADSLQDVTP